MSNRAIIGAILSCTLLAACGKAGPAGECRDLDDDGFRATECGGDDCDDTRPEVHPGATEVCNDGVDQDCDGLADGPELISPARDLMDEPVDDTTVQHMRIVWTGSEYGVAWSFDCHRLIPPGTYQGVFFTRLAGDGTPLMDTTFLDYATSHEEEVAGEIGLVWTGSEYGLSWVGLFHFMEMTTNWLYLRRLGAEGDPVGEVTALRTLPDQPARPELAWTGSLYALKWTDEQYSGDRLVLTTVDPDALPMGEDVVVDEAAGIPHSGMVWTGSEIALAYHTWDSPDGDHRMQFARYGEGGEEISRASWPLWGGEAIIGFSDGEFAISTTQYLYDEDARQIRFQRYEPRGDRIGEEYRLRLASMHHVEHLFSTRSGYLVVGHDHDAAPCFLHFDTASSDPIYEASLTGLLLACMRSDLAWTGSEFGLVWAHPVDATIDEYRTTVSFARISPCD